MQHRPYSMLRVVTRRSWWTRVGNATLRTASTRATNDADEQVDPKKKKKSVKTPSFDAVEFRKLVTAWAKYHEKEGHFVVPDQFQVPHLDESPLNREDLTFWPPETHGLPLGQRLIRYRPGLYRGNMIDERILGPMRSIGVPVDTWRQYVWKRTIFPALETYRRLYGHLFIKRHFVVPYGESQWPRATWKYPLGRKVRGMRVGSCKVTEEEKSDLASVEFIWHLSLSRWEQVILPALETFHQVVGHCTVPNDFVVPREPPWPPMTWEVRLGQVVKNIRAQGQFKDMIARDQARWDRLNFDWEPRKTRWNQLILPAVETFHTLRGHTNIRVDFVVPSQSPWPKATWALPLGKVVHNARRYKLIK